MRKTTDKKTGKRKDEQQKWFASDGNKIPNLSRMSPVRRRIELRRRDAADYYAICGEPVE